MKKVLIISSCVTAQVATINISKKVVKEIIIPPKKQELVNFTITEYRSKVDHLIDIPKISFYNEPKYQKTASILKKGGRKQKNIYPNNGRR